ncbi:hypothetical protein A4X06_0g9069 [Tilletia controversa]|uniref:Uncharacterized protein n=1 Tax=Tilletia controversa TaxID=13291 RepID=A0A8X7MJI2_9BASI|nr:hypothetical protein A4X06_0g9069 [Tilletia controversa]
MLPNQPPATTTATEPHQRRSPQPLGLPQLTTAPDPEPDADSARSTPTLGPRLPALTRSLITAWRWAGSDQSDRHAHLTLGTEESSAVLKHATSSLCHPHPRAPFSPACFLRYWEGVDVGTKSHRSSDRSAAALFAGHWI